MVYLSEKAPITSEALTMKARTVKKKILRIILTILKACLRKTEPQSSLFFFFFGLIALISSIPVVSSLSRLFFSASSMFSDTEKPLRSVNVKILTSITTKMTTDQMMASIFMENP